MAKGRELFSSADSSASEPLAARMRPRNLDEFVGQDGILGPGRLLRRAIQADQLSSLIFYGPPGSGKTTLARVIANTTKSRFMTMNAVLSGVADLRAAIEEAKDEKQYYERRSILFVDEVHRWNKAQQDALLPWVENGTFILIGATTENPYFEVNKALASRSRIFRLECLGPAELMEVAKRTIADAERGYGAYAVKFQEGALEHLVDTASGDARSLLNALELAVETTPASWPPPAGSEIFITLEAAEESIQRKVVLYDRDGDYHYDVISAFIKSLRGSDPDAALYWLARMVEAGESPAFIFRRMLVAASEDVGLAAPEAIGIVESCAAAFDRVGFPEGNFHLCQAALYLANCPKSNSALGIFDALASVRAENAEVPNHLKDASRDGEDMGHGQGYLYPHAYRDHWVAQAYLPSALKGKVFYHPGSQGWEARAALPLASRRELQLAAAMEERERVAASGQKEKDESFWRRSRGSGDEALALSERDVAFARALLRGHERVLVLNAGEGLFVWEALRRCRAGLVLGLCARADEVEALQGFCASMPEPERPILSAASPSDVDALRDAIGFEPGLAFEAAAGRNAVASGALRPGTAASIGALLGPGAPLSLCEILPGYGTRPSDLVAQADPDLAARMRQAEDGFYAGLYGTDIPESEAEEALRRLLSLGALELESCARSEDESPRFLGPAEIASWTSPRSAFGAFLAPALGPEALSRVAVLLRERIGEGTELPWSRPRFSVLARKAGKRDGP